MAKKEQEKAYHVLSLGGHRIVEIRLDLERRMSSRSIALSKLCRKKARALTTACPKAPATTASKATSTAASTTAAPEAASSSAARSSSPNRHVVLRCCCCRCEEFQAPCSFSVCATDSRVCAATSANYN